ncbi:MAG: tRNA preQ1(34) S-adenosylmethionine ribosyltransferase-isomerase QueA [Thermodesulfovibrionaceae bacterium]
MEITELDYTLPADLIAQEPLKERHKARLLVLHRDTCQIEHRVFFEIVEYFTEGDMLVINNSKVIPARLLVKKPTGGKLEILLIKEKFSTERETVWEIITRGNYEGEVFINGNRAELRWDEKGRVMIFKGMNSQSVRQLMYEKGFMPLPPYIKRKPSFIDQEYYQTVYAKKEGSIAAPTAGLHFTEELLEKIKQKGVLIREITLHVGIGTFKPIKVKEIEKHKMDEEFFEIRKDLIEEIQLVKKAGNRIFSTGTTTTRALEGYASGRYVDVGSNDRYIKGVTDIFICPGYEFKVIDALITNFHLPKSSPLALVSALCGVDKVKKAYSEAIKLKYRFFSYGDAMLIL